MASIELPWESETIVEISKGQAQVEKDTFPAVATLISHMKCPTEFAIVITLDEDKSPNAPTPSGFMAKMKSLGTSVANSAMKAQRAASASSKLSAVYDVKFVIPVCSNVDIKCGSFSFQVCWTEVITGEPINRQLKLSNVSEKFINSLKAIVEVSMAKVKSEFTPNGNNPLFSWLWKYHPIVPMPNGEISSIVGLVPKKSLGKVLSLTWNVAGLAPPDDDPNNIMTTSYSKLKTQLCLFFKNKLEQENLDVIYLSLQEASPLNAKTVMFKSDNFEALCMKSSESISPCSN